MTPGRRMLWQRRRYLIVDGVLTVVVLAAVAVLAVAFTALECGEPWCW